MGRKHQDPQLHKKKQRKTERNSSAALFLLRATQLGLTMEDLNNVSYGMVMDMYFEYANDKEDYDEIASQEDMNNF